MDTSRRGCGSVDANRDFALAAVGSVCALNVNSLAHPLVEDSTVRRNRTGEGARKLNPVLLQSYHALVGLAMLDKLFTLPDTRLPSGDYRDEYCFLRLYKVEPAKAR